MTLMKYSNVTHINSMKLIQWVRQYEVLYNHGHKDYTNKGHKNMIWDQICCQFFPAYESMMDDSKASIRLSVQRRWKGLRDAMSREMKKSATIENYVRKKESVLLSALEFLKPYIRTTYYNNKPNTFETGNNWTSANSTLESDEEVLNDQELDDLIDLTDADEMYEYVTPDEKKEFKGWGSDDGFDSESSVDDKHKVLPISGHPTSVMATPVFCTLAAFTNGEFVTSSIMETGTDTEEANSDEMPTESLYVRSAEPSSLEQPSPLGHDASENTSTLKKRTHPDDCNASAASAPEGDSSSSKRARSQETDIRAKLLQSLDSLEARKLADNALEDDEDRMFMLSLVSAMKRVPAAKKIQVKAEITAIIAHASQ